MGHGMHPGIMLIFALMHRGLVGKEEMRLAQSAQPSMEMGRLFWSLETVIQVEKLLPTKMM